MISNGKMAKTGLTDTDYFFTSQRLGFRKFKDEDKKLFFKINTDPKVMQFFPSVLTLVESNSLIEKINNHIDEYNFGFFAVDLLSENQFIGFIGLKRTSFDADFTPCVEIGWRLDAKFWNQGLATEGAQRCLKYAFTDLSISEVYSFTSLLNLPSERVMQKIGMQKIGQFSHPMIEDKDPLKEHCVYKITSIFIK